MGMSINNPIQLPDIEYIYYESIQLSSNTATWTIPLSIYNYPTIKLSGFFIIASGTANPINLSFNSGGGNATFEGSLYHMRNSVFTPSSVDIAGSVLPITANQSSSGRFNFTLYNTPTLGAGKGAIFEFYNGASTVADIEHSRYVGRIGSNESDNMVLSLAGGGSFTNQSRFNVYVSEFAH